MKSDVAPQYTFYITKLESCYEFMYFTVRLSKYTNFRILSMLTLDQYSQQIRSMSNDNTQISSLGVRHDWRPYSSQIGCMWSVITLLRSVGVSHVCSPYSAQFRCKSFVIIRISSLVGSHFSRLTSGFIKNANERISSLVTPNVSNSYISTYMMQFK
jgi:hypothetical protein